MSNDTIGSPVPGDDGNGHSGMKKGDHYLFFVPPSWILGGTIREVTSTDIVLDDAAWLEAIEGSKSSPGDLPFATSVAEQKSIISRGHGLPDGTRLARIGVLMAEPCLMDFKLWSRKKDADAIKGA